MTSDRDASAPDRLAALLQTELLDSPPEPGFDRVTRLATRLLAAPASIIALVDRDRQFFKSSVGLCEPWASLRETPLSHSFCQHVVTTAQPLVVVDASEHPLVKDNLAVPSL
ncbi:MAG: histidine kinase, partial [Bradyrhizobium sp.]|nr:histidine kinase [Bradyrhizobium sp.]